MSDVIDRTEMERGSQPFLSQIVETVADAILLIDCDRVVVFANAAAERILGVSRDELVGRSWGQRRWQTTLLDGSPVPADQRGDHRALEKGEPTYGMERMITRPDGMCLAISGNTVPLYDDEQELVGLVVSLTDITDRVRAEKEVRQRERYFRALVENSSDGIVLIDADCRMTYVTPSAERLLGYPANRLVGSIGFDYVQGEDLEILYAKFAECLEHPGQPISSVVRIRRGDGATRWVEAIASDWRADAEVGAIVVNFRDVTEREESAAALRASEERYRILFERNLAGVFRSRMDGTLLDCNDGFTRIFGFASRVEMLGRNTHSFDRTPEDRQRFAAALLEHGCLTNYESPMISRDGSPVWILENVAVRKEGGELVQEGTVIDITDRRRAEEQLRQAHKMEAIGQLAGGIAHDFNNLLTAILGNISLALDRVPRGDPARTLLEESEKAGWRAAELTGQLLGFARRSATCLEPLLFNRVVADTVSLLRRTIDPRVVVEVRSAPDLWPVLADAAQMHQLLLNLCLNARDAMPAGGKMTVALANAPVDAASAARHLDARPGEYVRLSVSDTGHGMTEDVRARMFEPFFTTKEAGKGTGLGLAMVFAVVKRHNGWIDCASVPGQGTRFDVYLPRATVVPADAQSDEPSTRGGTETILLVDDDALIRGLGQAILTQYGYAVVSASDGAEGVALFRRDHSRIGLVVMDMTMPKLSGKEAFAQIRQIDPEAKVLFCSGYSADNLTIAESIGSAGFVGKPYKPMELARAVRTALDR